MSDSNHEKNRYGNVRCLDTTRVILPVLSDGDSNFINANWIKLRASSRARFIATQVFTCFAITF